MILLVDVGNSNICFGIVENNVITSDFRIKTLHDKSSDEYYFILNNFIKGDLNDVIISSVVPTITSILVKLFKKYYNEEGIYVKALPEVNEGLEWVLTDKDVIATIKWDGSACAIINGELYKRYDARVKYGKTVPEGAIKC